MKVLMINGSPRKAGCTYTALSEIAKTLHLEGIETEFVHLGVAVVRGCTACFKCKDTGCCVFKDDIVNEWIEKIQAADGVIIGSPVYFAGPNGGLCAALDRVFHAGSGFFGKPASSVVSCRRGGSSAALDRLNKYFTVSNMPVVPSQYWNMVHGLTPDEVRQDAEGMQVMRQLGTNMAWMLKGQQKQGTMPLLDEPPAWTNFIR